MNDRSNTSAEMNDELEPQLEVAVWSVLSEPMPREAIERVKSQALALDNQQPVVIAGARSAYGSHSWAKIGALAACLLLAFGVLTMIPSRDAFAKVVEKLRKIATARFTIENIGANNFVAVASVKAPDRLRLDFQVLGQPVNITNGAAGELIAFDANSNQVSVNEIPKAKSDFDILQLLQAPDVRAVVSAEVNTLAGTQLYEIFNGQGRIWVDLVTQLPKRIEMTPPTGSGATKLVYRDFEWDVPLDDNLFAMPVGRDIVRSSLLASPKEAELVAAFSIRQSFSLEPYEASFLDKSTKPGLRLGQLAYDLTKDQAENYQMQAARLQDSWAIIGISQSEASDASLVQKRIDFLCMKLDQWAGDIARRGGWVGTGVRPGESRPLCWWKDGSRIRVLRGDLTIIDADQSPASN